MRVPRERKLIECKCGCGEKLMNISIHGNVRQYIHGHNKGHTTPHKKESIDKMKLGIKRWHETDEYKKFIEDCRERGKLNKNGFQRGHKMHEKYPHLKEKIREYQHGSKHWNWKGGITPEVIRLRGNKEYIAWRKSIFERDDYTCQECGVRGGYLEAHHHLIPFTKLFAEKNFKKMWDMDNGKTLCRACHDKTKLHYKKYYDQAIA